ncbi:MAG TPA: hypothetical protein GX002_08345 [Clostridiales bacterium]|jgi:hypothetical protein|nr:hypothetical protein [Clostridiales bacterium]
MLYISIPVIALMLFLYAKSQKHAENIPTDYDIKKHKLYFLYPMAAYFLTLTGLERRLLNKTEISRKIRALHVNDHQDFQIKLYWYQKISLFFLIIFAFSSISVITSLQTSINGAQTFDNTLIRPREGTGDSKLTLRFRMENKYDKEDIYEDYITINNKERTYTDEEWKKVLDKAIPYLEQKMLGDNKSAEYIDKDLDFIRRIPDTGITVEWIPQDYRLISGSGKLMDGKFSDKGASTLVTAVLRYKERRAEHTIPLTIWPVKQDKKTRLYRELQNILETTEKETSMTNEWKLPDKVGDYLIRWHISQSSKTFAIFAVGIAGSVLLWFFMDRSLDDKMKTRNNQMLLDYPEIINKFNLLINAGMTIRQAWSKITEDYIKNTKSVGRQTRYAYEEMLVTLHELKLGVAEADAYEQFGIRAGFLPFMKFSSILVQNLKKGNRSMTDLLKQEAAEAFQERKEAAKRLGEEASAKLLGPMMILLFIVLIIILVPAFISFRF